MMSLLLTFFILMFSMSELKMDRFLLASQGMREAMGGTAAESIPDPMGLMPDPVDPDLQLQNPGKEAGASDPVEASGAGDEIRTVVEAYMEMIVSRLEAFVAERGLERTVTVQQDGEGVYLRMQTAALFPSGTATLQPAGKEALRELADITSSISVRVAISGHADNEPIHGGPFASNWELSAARAAGVARELVEHGQDPRLVRVESFGEYRPIGDNGTAEGRAQNRRVELYYARVDVVAAVMEWARLAELQADSVSAPGEAPSRTLGS
jgi:chemotaxis protein MotB